MNPISDLLDFIYPRRCHICGGNLLPGQRFICEGCLQDIPRSGYHRRHMNPLEERFAGLFPFERATGLFLYSAGSPLSILIQDMKYRRFPSIGDMLGERAGIELYSTGFFSGIDLILPVPMHFIKRMRRGYNQTDHIASGISKATGIPVSHTLTAIRGHRTQTALTREERLENTAGLFRVKQPQEVTGRHILLVDDICTTGSTIISAAKAIWEAHPSALSILTLGVTF